jgi:transcriptional regulator with XRE-family HTH domain
MADDTLKAQIGKNIRRIRKERGMTQEQVAQQIGITWRNFQRYERGLVVPRGDNLAKAAKALDVSEEELVGIKPGPKGKEANLVQLASDIARLESQVNDLLAWKRDQEQVNRLIQQALRPDEDLEA